MITLEQFVEINGDVDGGRCFEIRSKAIGDIIEYLKQILEVEVWQTYKKN